MAEWYLDLETEGPDPVKDRILTIQYQRLEGTEPVGPFQVVAEWEWGEKQIVRFILEKHVLEPTSEFVPLGERLRFGLSLLMEKAERYDLRKFTAEEIRRFWYSKPMLDLEPLLRIVDEGRSDVAAQKTVAGWYREGRYQEIIDYVARDKDATLKLVREAKSRLGSVVTNNTLPSDPP